VGGAGLCVCVESVDRAFDTGSARCCSVYLHYWYKRTNTDALESVDFACDTGEYLYSVYLLYWYKSTKSNATGAAGGYPLTKVQIMTQQKYK
jgi:hypothetical protein